MIDVNAKGVDQHGRGDACRTCSRAAAAISSRSPPRPAAAASRFEAVYCASKFAQVGFTRALDHELRPQGIRCTNVCPGGVATDFAMEEGRGRTPEMPELAGMMSAADVAEAVALRAHAPARATGSSRWRSGP